MQNGKGDKTRPLSVSRKEFDKNWEMIFGPKKETTEKQEVLDDKPEKG